jgi:hypothetical protein
MIKHSGLLQIILFAGFILSACGILTTPVPTPTASPVPSPTDMPGIEVNVNRVSVLVTEIHFGKYKGFRVTDNVEDLGALGGLEAEPGFHYAEVIVEVLAGASAEEVSQWAVTLQDSEAKAYVAATSGWGVFLGGENTAGWTFHIPENTSQMKLIFPEDISVDLSPLLAK